MSKIRVFNAPCVWCSRVILSPPPWESLHSHSRSCGIHVCRARRPWETLTVDAPPNHIPAQRNALRLGINSWSGLSPLHIYMVTNLRMLWPYAWFLRAADALVPSPGIKRGEFEWICVATINLRGLAFALLSATAFGAAVESLREWVRRSTQGVDVSHGLTTSVEVMSLQAVFPLPTNTARDAGHQKWYFVGTWELQIPIRNGHSRPIAGSAHILS